MVHFLQQSFLQLTLPLLAATLPLSHTLSLSLCLSGVLLFFPFFLININTTSVYVFDYQWIIEFSKELFSFKKGHINTNAFA
jgi:hypothetical protein